MGFGIVKLKENIYYWKISLKHPEPVVDDYYIFDQVIISDEDFIRKIERLRELIISFCVIFRESKEVADKVLDEIYEIITSIDKIQYTEFIAFWKVLDMSYSVFRKLPNQKLILRELLQKYCERRRKLYDNFGYSHTTVQALYDSGASRKKGKAGIYKLIDLVRSKFKNARHIEELDLFNSVPVGYFLPDKGDKSLFMDFCKKFKVEYKFGMEHQGKEPDMVLKVSDHFFIIEAKHIKESGGAQDKQIVEIVEFIKHSESNHKIHYLSFVDGVYFNNFVWNGKDSKISRQRNDIEEYLKTNKNNFFVNTFGFATLLKDLSK